MIEIYFNPHTELDVFDYVDQINTSGSDQADIIVEPDVYPGFVARLFDNIRDINWELEGVSLAYDRLGNCLISLRKKNSRGGIGFRFNGEDKICFVGHDASPSGIGKDLLIYLKRHSIEELKEICSKIIFTDDWKFEGWNGKEFHSKIFESSPCLNNSLFCEYAYIINLDDGVLEYYRGGNQNPNAKGRYAHNKAPTIRFEYYGVRLTQKVQLNKINKYKITNNYEEPFIEGSEEETNVMDNKELTFKGSIKFVDGKMVTAIDVLDDDKVVSTSIDSVDCDINQIVTDSSKVVLRSAASDGKENQEVETFSSGIWTILLKDVLKTVGGVLVAQLKKKVQEKLKDKFSSKD